LSGSLENKAWRQSSQELPPLYKESTDSGRYDIYPSFLLPENKISVGYESLSAEIARHKVIIIDGYIGVFFEIIKSNIDRILKSKGISAGWTDSLSFLKNPGIISSLKEPFLGGNDPLFGTRCTLSLDDFFETGELKNIHLREDVDVNIIIGPGASLSQREGLLVYIDLPKNEIQFRARAGSICNLGSSSPGDPKKMYKCFYFVDWIIFNSHKQKILQSIGLFVDGQRPDNPSWMKGNDLRSALSQMSRKPFRARPWFEPGPWGGKWIMEKISGLNKSVSNYAWSFELITPENGILLESSEVLIEVSFDCLMFHCAKAILGDCYDRFKYNFPIRFDFLDTFDGGNLSLQCHPVAEYTKNNFGEDFTQEEAYYILDTRDNASVYLGFQENIDPAEFKTALENSRDHNTPFDAGKFIQQVPSGKHDLFLIPPGTIHGSGKNNLVLEISSTPYIFTFKMYDWLRNDLDGKPRTLNIERAMENLCFDRNGDYVRQKLISRPEIADSGKDWTLLRLPTHDLHLYDVMRYHFIDRIKIQVKNKFLVMSLVEGTSVDILSEDGTKHSFSFAETFIVPANAGNIEVYNKSESEAILVFAFVK
jgi:mannose-6-phosphate isomerase class I